MDRRLIYGGIAAALLGSIWYVKFRKPNPQLNTGRPIVDPNAPTSIAQQTVPVQGVTDANGNLDPQFSWPYNQLALPYNFNQATGNLGNYQDPSVIGNQQTVVF